MGWNCALELCVGNRPDTERIAIGATRPTNARGTRRVMQIDPHPSRRTKFTESRKPVSLAGCHRAD
jgi:hypothetical protein